MKWGVLCRFSDAGVIEAFDGNTGAYAQIYEITYEADTTYPVEIHVDFDTTDVYSVFVDDGALREIATDYEFRVAVTQFDAVTIISELEVGTFTLDNIVLESEGDVTDPTPATQTVGCSTGTGQRAVY